MSAASEGTASAQRINRLPILLQPITFPRPGRQIHQARCQHAASGCNYPEGDCAGLCLVVAPAKAT
ncbi:MAG: hypothetical protein U1E12_10265 [Hydrogenophaga sp.]|uniref:hypothetical protein n=1 Tax=Hydrogenophaga sp. TaxID=1904254 RepID=UPI002ABB74F5|nr:hypothetical protein [Hydrogenophaga sp.]MDZ4102046.1 hypothetical protein [Hydrogenophaga sp.]